MPTMSPESSFADLIDRLRQNDPDAAARLWRQYVRRLVGLARRRLDARLRPKVDPEEVVQSVFRTLFRRLADGEFDLADRHGLWALLVRITLRKCGQQLEHFQALCRDFQREVPLPEPARGDEGEGAGELAAAGPPPAEEAALDDLTVQVRRRLGSPLKVRIFELALAGYTVPEISAEARYYQRGVERVRAEIRQILAELAAT
jgi:RNA polymerase sigma-70 factor (ECF subfamily)